MDQGQEQTQLSQKFTFYFIQTDGKINQFAESLRKVGLFETVEGFWAYYQHMTRPDSLPAQAQFFLFQQDFKPLWETEGHKGGGRFKISVKKQFTNRFWEDLILGFISDDCKEQYYILGIQLSNQKTHSNIHIWLRDLEDNKQREKNIRQWICSSLGISSDMEKSLIYSSHNYQKAPELKK